jgi:hypothetical protein
MSPSKLREMIAHSRSEMALMIIEKACIIEENIKAENTISKKIDLSVIEDLKRRRMEQNRTRGGDLEAKREQII